jgi:hypothetical protein
MFQSFWLTLTPGRSRSTMKAGHALVAGRGIRLGEDEVPVGLVAVGDPHFLAVDHVLVAPALGAGANRGDVGAGVGLGDAVRAEEALLGHAAEVLLLLGLGAGDDDGHLRQGVGLHGGADAGAAPAVLLGDEHAVEGAEPEAAARLGDVRVHQPELPRLLQRRVGVLARLVVVARDLADFVDGEVAGEAAEGFLFAGELEIDHVGTPEVGWGVGWARTAGGW